MRCETCRGEMTACEATLRHTYAYALSGLRRVRLAGVTVWTCRRCGVERPVIPRLGELHRVIALNLVEKAGPLRGDEIRFLRKWAGFPARKFAALIGVSPEHLSRIENGHTDALGPPSDRLARAIAVASRDADEAREILLRVADELETTRRPKAKAGIFSLERNRWKAAA